MPGPVPGTHVLLAAKKDVGGRDKPGHDALGDSTRSKCPRRTDCTPPINSATGDMVPHKSSLIRTRPPGNARSLRFRRDFASDGSLL